MSYIIPAVVCFLCVNLISVDALSCYECDNHNGSSCFDPINTQIIDAVDCRHSRYVNATDDRSKFQCVFIEETDPDNKTYVFRQCVVQDGRNCQEYIVHERRFRRTVTKCLACTSDRCNTSRRLHNFFCLTLVTCIFFIFLSF